MGKGDSGADGADMVEAVTSLHRQIDVKAQQTARHHQERLQCAKGCSACCSDDLSVFEVEAHLIRAHCQALLHTATPHPPGKCAFLSTEGACRIYAHRPYVCRTQGLPLRWLDDEMAVEYRDICPLNEPGPPLEDLSAETCWTLGEWEGRLAALQFRQDGGQMRRVALRSLFDQTQDQAG